MSFLNASSSLAKFKRSTRSAFAEFNLNNSTCLYHQSHEAKRDCNINDSHSDLQYLDTLIIDVDSLYRITHKEFCCHSMKSYPFNPILSTHKILFGQNDYVKVFDMKNVRILYCHSRGHLVSHAAISHLSMESIQNPEIGPGHWYDILLRSHYLSVQKDLTRAGITSCGAKEVEYFTAGTIMSEHCMRDLFYFTYFHEWEPFATAVNRIIFSMGGRVVSIDWNQKLTKPLSEHQRHSTDEAIPFNVGDNEFAKLLHAHLKSDGFSPNDCRRTITKCKAALLNMQNSMGFCMLQVVTPNNSEAHAYLLPYLSETVAKMMTYAIKPVDLLVIKTDGYEGNINLAIKVINYMITMINKKILIGEHHCYNLVAYLKQNKALVACDLFHRCKRLPTIMYKKDDETIDLFRDRTAISYALETRPRTLNLAEFVDILSYAHARQNMYASNTSFFKSMKLYVKCLLRLKRTSRKKNRNFWKMKLQVMDKDVVETIRNELRYALTHICGSQLCYYGAMLLGWFTVEELLNLQDGQFHFMQGTVRHDVSGSLSRSKVKTPNLGAPPSVLRVIGQHLRLLHLEREYLITAGVHSFTHFYGMLEGLYKYVPVFCSFELRVDS